MKVLQVNCVYKFGSTGKITSDIHEGLKQKGIDSVVCYGRGGKIKEPGVYKTCGELYSHINHFFANLTGIMYGGCFFSTNRLISIIRKEKPDIVHLQCINGYFVNIYRLLNWLKKNKIKTVVTLHAEFMHTGGCGHSIDCVQWNTHIGCGHSHCPRYKQVTGSWLFDRTASMWRRMKKAFEGFDDDKLIVTSVSPWLMDRAKQSPILKDKRHVVVLNGLDDKAFYRRDEEACKALRKELGIEDGVKVIFHATPNFNDDIHHIKGGYYVLKLAERMKGEKVKFVVAGSYKEGIAPHENVILLGAVSDQEKLATLYSLADLTLLTSQRETFSMVTAESLCCGTPLVGFKAGGPEQIAISDYSEFAEYGDLESLDKALHEMLDRKINREALSEVAIKKYSKETMTDAYMGVYEELEGKK